MSLRDEYGRTSTLESLRQSLLEAFAAIGEMARPGRTVGGGMKAPEEAEEQ
jgi:hypothetical protein